jgi:Sulfotransferase family
MTSFFRVREATEFLASATYRRVYRLYQGETQPVIFVVGHMRAGSTLLSLILLTHEAITGGGERNRVYRTPFDLDWLALNVRWMHRSFRRRYRYMVDQINHSHFTPDPQLLNHPRLRILFLIREPVATVSSILRLTAEFYELWPLQRAVDYYVERLTTLTHYAHAIQEPAHALALTYDDLIGQSAQTFEKLRQFLALDTGFSETYTLQRFTGSRGDPTALIKQGHIVRDHVRTARPIPEHLLARAWEAYSVCNETLNRFRWR